MSISRRTVLGGGVALGAAIVSRASATEELLVINTYGGRWGSFWREHLLPQLQTEIDASVRLEIGVGAAWVSAFRAAGKQNPPFPCLMTNERYAAGLRDDGFFAPLSVAEAPNLADLYPLARYPGDVSVTGMISPIGLAYRKDLLKAPPRSWKDLWRPEYKGQIGFYSIDNSAAIMLVMLAGRLFGAGERDIETGVRKIAELKPFPQAAFSGQLSPMLAQGQVALAPIDFAEGYALQKKGVPLELVAPDDGVLMYDQSFNLAAQSSQRALAARYVNFMLSPEIQLMLAREFYVAPVNAKVTVPEDLRGAVPVSGDNLKSIVRFDWEFVAQQAGHIGQLWSAAI